MGEYLLKNSVPQLLGFGIDSVLKILDNRMTQSINQYEWMNESVNHKSDCKTALATPGPFKSTTELKKEKMTFFIALVWFHWLDFCLACNMPKDV